jgi:ABC-type branched-subunit amino acid transport system substrate-binding protein/mono/diheme cytochrome c family protein
MSHLRSLLAAVTLLFVNFLLISSVFAGHLSPQERRGKQIYFEGTSRRGHEIEAYIGENYTPLPGSAATCASCHGPDGRGRPEAGVIPSDITWDYLMKPYGHTHPMERKHAAFTEDSLKECILFGYDPAGHQIDPSMPLYSMSEEDLDDLVAYMKRLQTDLDPGLAETAIRIGTILPTRGRMAILGQGMLEVMAAYFDDINSGGGIYNRKLELIESPYDNTKQTPLPGAMGLVGEGDVFAVVSPVVAGADKEIADLAQSEGVPFIGPFTLFSPDPYALNDFTFYLFSGLKEQALALVDFAAQELKLENPRIAVLSPDSDNFREIVETIEEQCQGHGWSSVTSVNLPPGNFEVSAAAEKLKEEKTDALFFLESRGLEALIKEAEKINWRPYIFLSGALIRKGILDLPVSFQKRIYLSYPTLPSDQTRAGVSEFQTLLKKRGFSVRHLPSQISALVAAKILVEGLKRSGRDLSREKFIRVLEKLYEFQTGLTPRITYGPNRRVGALGAYVVSVDLEKKDFVPVGEWITPTLSDGSGEWILTKLQDEKISAKGQDLFTTNCAVCHFPDHTDTKIGPGLKGVFKNPRLPGSGRPTSEDTVRRQIQRGGEKMPPFRNLNEEEVTTIIDYLRTL